MHLLNHVLMLCSMIQQKSRHSLGSHLLASDSYTMLLSLGACTRDTVFIFVCVCYHANCYKPGLCVENKVPLGFLWYFQDTCTCTSMCCVDFIETLCSKFQQHLLTTHALASRFLMSS